MRLNIKKPKIKHIIWFVIFCIIFAVGYKVTYNTSIEHRMAYPHLFSLTESTTYMYEYEEDGNKTEAKREREYTLTDGDVLVQNFTYTKDSILSVGARVFINEDVKNEGSIDVVLSDDAGNEIASATFDLESLSNSQLLMASLPEGIRYGYLNRPLTYTLTAHIDSVYDINISLGDAEDNPDTAYVTVNGEEIGEYVMALRGADRQLTYWGKIYKIGAILFFIALAWVFWALAITNIKLENVFVPVALIIALLFLTQIPPEAVPDERDHMLEAYEKVNVLFGLDTPENYTAYLDAEDYKVLDVFENMPSLTEFDDIKEHITDSGRIEGSVIDYHTYMHATTLAYLPGVLGILFARLLGLNGYLVWISGRIMAIIFYLIMMRFAIKTAPAMKGAFFAIALFPMTVQQCCSYSYDGMIIEAVCVLMAILLKWIYCKDEPIRKVEIGFLIYSVLLLAVCKGGCYMPLVLLSIFIPRERFGTRKKTIIGKLLIIGLAGVAWLTCTLGYAFYVLAPTGTESTTLTYTDAEAYTISEVLSNLWIFIEPSIKSIIDYGGDWLIAMFGTGLGWLNIDVTSLVPITMSIIVLIAMIPVKGKEDVAMIGLPEKVAIVLFCLMSTGLIFLSMFLDWTPKDAGFIWGIQARYFLPLFPAAILLFRSRWMTVEKDLTKYIAFIAVATYGLTFYDILLELQKYLE